MRIKLQDLITKLIEKISPYHHHCNTGYYHLWQILSKGLPKECSPLKIKARKAVGKVVEFIAGD